MKWKVLNSTYSFECPWLKIRKDHIRMPSGQVIPDFYVEELPDWVNVIAITEDGHYILEEQYRHGIQKVCFELPAGVVEAGEDPLTAAKRELEEETGYTGGEWSCSGWSCPNASGSSNRCYHFIAKGVEAMSFPRHDVTEDIKIHLVSYNDLRGIVGCGQIVESVMLVPLLKLLLESN